eukprot:6429287-Prymnesium_polylepis.1
MRSASSASDGSSTATAPTSLLFGEERLAARQDLGLHRRRNAGGDRAVGLREAVLVHVAGGEPAHAA